MMCLLFRFKACTICKTVGTCATLVLAQTNVKSVLWGVLIPCFSHRDDLVCSTSEWRRRRLHLRVIVSEKLQTTNSHFNKTLSSRDILTLSHAQTVISKRDFGSPRQRRSKVQCRIQFAPFLRVHFCSVHDRVQSKHSTYIRNLLSGADVFAIHVMF